MITIIPRNVTWRFSLFVFLVFSLIGYFIFFYGSANSPTSRVEQPTAEEGILLLHEGNQRFANNRRRFPRLDKARVVETALAQKPFATVLTCSDSRIPVENIFDAGIGDLFVVRVAGNVCSDHEIGSIEYGVEHLKTPLVLIMGHTYCGAVKAVVEDADVRGKFHHLAEHIIPSYDEAKETLRTQDRELLLKETVRRNVRRAMRDLEEMSPGVRQMRENGKVTIAGALYDLRTGSVEWLTP